MKKASIKVRLILYNKGKILLLRQRKRQGGNYTLVGGTVDANEFALDALMREAEEESGIILQEEDMQLVHVLHKHTKFGAHRVTLYFKASKWKGELRTGEPSKFKGVSWFSLDKLPTNLSSTVRHVLVQYRDGNLYSEFTNPNSSGSKTKKGSR